MFKQVSALTPKKKSKICHTKAASKMTPQQTARAHTLLLSLCRPWPGVHSLPTSCDPSPVASTLVRVLLLHDHLVRNWRSGQLQPSLCLPITSCNFVFRCPYANLSFCHSPVHWAGKHHNLCNGSLPFPYPKRISSRASSADDLCCLLFNWPVIGVRGKLEEAHSLTVM